MYPKGASSRGFQVPHRPFVFLAQVDGSHFCITPIRTSRFHFLEKTGGAIMVPMPSSLAPFRTFLLSVKSPKLIASFRHLRGRCYWVCPHLRKSLMGALAKFTALREDIPLKVHPMVGFTIILFRAIREGSVHPKQGWLGCIEKEGYQKAGNLEQVQNLTSAYPRVPRPRTSYSCSSPCCI